MSTIFRLNSLTPPPKISDGSKNAGENGALGDRSGLELSSLCSEPPKISGEIFAQTLNCLLKSLQISRGIEKNLLAKKFIKSIIYAKESIQINLFYRPKNSGAEKEKSPEKIGGSSKLKLNRSPARARTSDIMVNSHALSSLLLPAFSGRAGHFCQPLLFHWKAYVRSSDYRFPELSGFRRLVSHAAGA